MANVATNGWWMERLVMITIPAQSMRAAGMENALVVFLNVGARNA